MTTDIKQKNKKLITTLVLVTVAMFGFGYALVPLYDVLCEITGINGKVEAAAQQEAQYAVDKSREITVEFITSVNKSAPLVFKAQTTKMKVSPGEYHTVFFYAENTTDHELLAQAIPSVSPGLAAGHFKKTECFCFVEQTFKPHEGKTMPVRFVIDPKLPTEYRTVTLAYTFFDNTDKKQ